MAYVCHEINALISIDPNLAKQRILATLREAKMHRGLAAEKLGCNYATLHRWIKRLELDGSIAFLAAKAKREGWFHGRTGGRPHGKVAKKSRAKKRVKSS